MPVFTLPKFAHPDFRYPDRAPRGPSEIDWSNPIAKGLVFATYFEGFKTEDKLGAVVNTDTGTRKYNGWEQTSTEVIRYEQPVQFDFGVGSLLMSFESNGNAPATAGRMFIISDSFLAFRNSSDTQLNFQVSGSSFVASPIPDLWVSGVERKLAFTWDATANERTVQVDDTKFSSTGSFTEPTATDDIILLNRADGTRNGEGTVRYALIFNRAISDVEIAELNRNPYQLLKPSTPTLFFPSVSGEIAPVLRTHSLLGVGF